MFKSNVEKHGIVKPHERHVLTYHEETGEPTPDVLHIIIPYSNYSNFNSRLDLHFICREHLEKLPGCEIWIVEVALADRPFVVTDAANDHHIQLRTNDIIWHKESMINVAVRILTNRRPEWRYVAWVDGDIRFSNSNVCYQTIHKLQTYAVVQMFSSVVNLGPRGQIYDTHHGFCYMYAKNGYKRPKDIQKYENWHPGFAWACTRKAFTDMGGLIDWAILGSADHHMILALVGDVMHSVHKKASLAYVRKLVHWQDRVERTIARNVGFVEGTIEHAFHGKYKDRKYVARWDILIETDYNPDTDIKYDENGLIMFDKPKPRLRDLIRHYFDSRNEDTVEAE